MDVLYTAKINMLGLGMNVYVYVCVVVGGEGSFLCYLNRLSL